MVQFDRDNENHMNIAKGTYYAWYGPKAAAELMEKDYNIAIPIAMLTRLYYTFKSAGLPRYDRAAQLKAYLK